jgi:hypothetical protein
MISLAQMTADEQHKAVPATGTEMRSGHLVVGAGPWYRDGDEWRVDRTKFDKQEGHGR